MRVKSEQDAQEIFKKLVEKQINEVMSQYANNIRIGRVTDVNVNSRQVNVEIYGTGEILNSIKYQKGVSFGVFVNDTALVISPDPKLRGQNYVVGVY